MTLGNTLAAVVLAAGTVLGAANAFGQNALGDGTALDRNLQRNSDRRNPRGRDVAASVRLQEAIATGNAAAGLSFRGDVGYRAPTEFRSSLGSNDLFAWQRESAYSAAPSAKLRGTDLLGYQSALLTGDSERSGLSGPLQVDRAQSGSSALNPFQGRSTLRGFQPTVVGTRVGADGSKLSVKASPLTGLQVVPNLPVGTDPRETEMVKPAKVNPIPEGAPRLNPDPEEDKPKDNPLAVNTKVDSSAASGVVETKTTARDEMVKRLHASMKPSSATGGAETEEAKTEFEKRLAETRARLMGETPKAKRDAKKDGKTDGKTDGVVETPKPGEEAPASDGAKKPTAKEERDARAARRERMKQAVGTSDPLAVGLDPVTLNAIRTSGGKVDKIEPSAKLGKVYAETMISAQQDLQNGKFFDAQNRFGEALRITNEDPVAIAGQAHAQIGAGLYLSAAQTLTNLLTTQPEMASMRYDAKLLPPADRLTVAAGQLRTRMKSEDPGVAHSAALLLAYVGFQTGDKTTMNDGLEGLKAATDPTDESQVALLTFVRTVWPNPGPVQIK